MKILVAIKQVPERDAALHIAPDSRSLNDADVQWTMNEPDAYALEEALRLRDAAGSGEVVVLSAGPDRVASTLRDALAKGADRALHITAEDLASRDTLGVARLLADAIRADAPDLILTGLQSDDLGFGQTGVVLAELLGIPHVTLVLHIDVVDAGLRVKRELEDGWYQHIDLPLPALVTIQSGGNQLRYATLMGIKRAKSKETRTLSAATATAAALLPERITLPERQRRTEHLTGSPAQIAAQLVEKLRFEVKAL